MQTVALIDYGSGNLRSAEKALLAAAGTLEEPCEVAVTAEPETVAAADRIVLPGVGAFAALMDLLNARPGLVEAMDEAVRGRGAPFLGVCVGMQLLATRGLEFGASPGLDWIPGEVRRLEPRREGFGGEGFGGEGLKVPHMGWNEVAHRPHPLFEAAEGAAPSSTMYFTHSFAFHPDDEATVVGVTDHGGRFASAIAKDNIAGVQFHPEKSQSAGLALIARFLEWRP